MNPLDLRKHILETLNANKALDIVTIDITEKSFFADYLIIASGSSSRHVSSMADHLHLKLKSSAPFLRWEGKQQGEWVLIDTGEIVIHLFKPEIRKFYDLEKLWNPLSQPIFSAASL
jgi:ribosome-associated protein